MNYRVILSALCATSAFCMDGDEVQKPNGGGEKKGTVCSRWKERKADLLKKLGDARIEMETADSYINGGSAAYTIFYNVAPDGEISNAIAQYAFKDGTYAYEFDNNGNIDDMPTCPELYLKMRDMHTAQKESDKKKWKEALSTADRYSSKPEHWCLPPTSNPVYVKMPKPNNNNNNNNNNAE